jgi:hypothetical protein
MPLFNRTKTPQKRLILLVLLLLYLASLLVGVGVGANRYTAGQVLSGLLNPNSGNLYTIISGVRLPRVLVASLVGVCLSLSGCILQGVMRNDLASPSTIGVTAGASFAGLPAAGGPAPHGPSAAHRGLCRGLCHHSAHLCPGQSGRREPRPDDFVRPCGVGHAGGL